KSPLNSMLNNEYYNWRNLLYRISSRFAKLCPTPDGKISALIAHLMAHVVDKVTLCPDLTLARLFD
ncbi:MAG: hypothetical protein LHW51_10945, partial [Candidatus Cloacimonetes bacterium]|nr:hypothetical protein [Candidatus Cloacimonadota bacterium]